MPNKLLVAALAATMTLVASAQASADSVKKKTAAPEEQTEKTAEEEAMEDAMFGVAVDVIGGGLLRKSKMPQGGKVVVKEGLKAVKNAKKNADKEKSGKKDPLKALFGGGDDEE